MWIMRHNTHILAFIPPPHLFQNTEQQSCLVLLNTAGRESVSARFCTAFGIQVRQEAILSVQRSQTAVEEKHIPNADLQRGFQVA